MSSTNYLICQTCQKNILLITIFFDVEELKIEMKCKCNNKYIIMNGEEFINLMNKKINIIEGNCQKNNHINIKGQIYCYSCNKVLCSECANSHFNEFNNIHKTISNDINKIINNKNNLKVQKNNDKNFKELNEKIKLIKELIEIENKKIYNDIINEIKDNSIKRYKRILFKSYNFNKTINNLIFSLYQIIKSNYIDLKRYNLEEPSINLFSNFIINEKLKTFYDNYKNYNKNKNILEKISFLNSFFLNNFIIKKKLIYPEIVCIATCKGHTSSIDCIIQLFDGRIATGSSDGTVKIWDEKNYKLLKTLKIDSHQEDPIYSIHQMKNSLLIYGTESGNFYIWDINSYQITTFIRNSHLRSIWGFMNVGKNKIVSISEDETIKVWNIYNFKLIKSININEGMILSEWTAEDGNLITGCENGKILIWDMNNYSCIKTLKGHDSGVDYIIQLNDYRIVSGAQDMKLKIWDYFTGQCLGTLIGHMDKVETLLELKDSRVVSGSWDNTFKVWDIYNYQCLLTINAHNDYILVIELLKGEKFASGSNDNILKIWESIYNENQIIKNQN